MDNRAATTLHRRAAFQPSTFDSDARTVELVWSTGAQVARSSWFDGDYIEELSMAAGAVDLDRLNAGASVLNSHDSSSLASVLGVVEKAWLADGEGRARVRFSSRAEVAPIVADIADGVLRNVSVGYSVTEWEREEPKQRGGLPVMRAVRWEPMELSIVAVPADPGARLRHQPTSDSSLDMSDTKPTAGHEPAPTIETRQEPAVTATPESNTREADLSAARAEASRAKLEVQIAKAAAAAGYPSDKLDELISRSDTMAAATFELLSFMKARSENAQPPAADQRAPFTVTQPEGADLVKRMGTALQYRIRPEGGMPEEAREFRNASLTDLARLCIEKAGVSTLGMSRREMATRAFHVSSDFADLFTSTAERSLMMAYEEEPHSWSGFCRRKDFKDFREVKDLALSASMVPTALREAGEYKARTMRVDDMAASLTTYAQKITVTREMIINDDLDSLSRVPELLGRGCRTLEQNLVIALITGNALTAIDGVALYDASHNNTGTGALDLESIAAGVAAMRKQTDPSGERLNVEAAFLLVPAALELKARQLLAPAAYYPAQSAGNDGPNIYQGQMAIYVDPRFDTASATQFHLVANPNRIPTIRYGYLEGESGPVIDPLETRDPDGVTLLCRHDFGVSLSDFRGFYRSTGA